MSTISNLAVEEVKTLIETNIKTVSRKTIEKASPHEISLALSYTVRDIIMTNGLRIMSNIML